MRLIWHYEVINKERLHNVKSVIIVANHISWFDPPFIGALTPFEIAYLGKAELFKNKIFGFLLRKVNCIPVVRHKVDMTAINTSMQILESGKCLLMFPQGTRHGKKIKPGVSLFAMKMKKDILPIYIENADKPLDCFFFRKKTRLIIGQPIKYEYFADWEQNKENYQKLADFVFSKIMELKND